jgi:hypothetical protein
VQVSANGGVGPRRASDSLALVYRNGNDVLKVNLTTGATVQVKRRETLFSGL